VYAVKVDPASVPDEDITWSADVGNVEFIGGDNKGRTVVVRGKTLGDFKLEIDIQGALSPKPFIKGRVLEKKTVNVYLHIVRDNSGENPAMTIEHFSNLLSGANRIFEQAAIEFALAGSVRYIDNDEFLNVDKAWYLIDGMLFSAVAQLQSTTNGTGGLEIYCVVDIFPNCAGISMKNGEASDGITIDHDTNSAGLAHELGHALGLKDVYVMRTGNIIPANMLVQQEHMRDDWSGGSGTGYYNSKLTHRTLLQRLIMYGTLVSTTADFPLGRVYGLDEIGELSDIRVGIDDMGDRQPTHW